VRDDVLAELTQLGIARGVLAGRVVARGIRAAWRTRDAGTGLDLLVRAARLGRCGVIAARRDGDGQREHDAESTAEMHSWMLSYDDGGPPSNEE
jgi:hypothetical protein